MSRSNMNLFDDSFSWQAYRIKDDLKKVIYGVLRCPDELLSLLKVAGDMYKWEQGGWG